MSIFQNNNYKNIQVLIQIMFPECQNQEVKIQVIQKGKIGKGNQFVLTLMQEKEEGCMILMMPWMNYGKVKWCSVELNMFIEELIQYLK